LRGARRPRISAAAVSPPYSEEQFNDEENHIPDAMLEDDHAVELDGENAQTVEAPNILLQLSDVSASEYIQLLADWVLNQVLVDNDGRYSDKDFAEWYEELWKQLPGADGADSIDAELHAFLLAETESSTSVSNVVDKLAKPGWRMGKGIQQSKMAKRDAAL
jgi:hypothetical protein